MPHHGRTAWRPLVIIGGKTWPKDLRWIVGICAVTALAAAAYGAEWSAAGRLPGGSSRTGLAAGIVGGLIIVFELLLWPRRRVRSWRIGSAQAWLRRGSSALSALSCPISFAR